MTAVDPAGGRAAGADLDPAGGRAAGADVDPVAAPRPRAVRLLLSNRVSLLGAAILVLVVVTAVFGPVLAPYGQNDVDVDNLLAPPSLAHPFGTDDLGRDVLSRVLIAARVSMVVSTISVGIALLAGVLLGVLSGYLGGWVDAVVMRVVDVLFAFPVMLLAIAIVAVLGPGVVTATVAIGVVYTPIFARVTRASVLTVREELFVRASRAIGSSGLMIVRRHVLPNIAAPVIVQTSLSLAFAILTEAALSFLGLGVQPPAPSWGRMLFDAKAFLEQAWWLGVFPGLAVLVTVLACNLLGDGLRDVMDPRQRSIIESRRVR